MLNRVLHKVLPGGWLQGSGMDLPASTVKSSPLVADGSLATLFFAQLRRTLFFRPPGGCFLAVNDFLSRGDLVPREGCLPSYAPKNFGNVSAGYFPQR